MVFHVGGHFFLNKINQQQWEKLKAETSTDSFSQEGKNQSINDTFEQDNSLDYLPNELKFTTKYYNETLDMILSGANNRNKQVIIEFFRGITLCHQANVVKDHTNPDIQKYICVLHDEIASLEFAQQQDFKLVQRGKKMITVLLQGN
jgi:magnesium-transporting ATPase (P-type)